MKTILVTAAGGILSRSLVKCLRRAQEELHIVGIDNDPTYIPLSPLNDAYVVPPFADEHEYLEAIKHLDKKMNFDFIFPQTDREIYIFAEYADHFEGKLWLPPFETIKLCQDKFRTNQTLVAAGVSAPLSLMMSHEGVLPKLESLFSEKGSLWIRNTVGSGGKGAKLCRNVREATEWIEENDGWGNFMASEHLPGRIFGWDSLWEGGNLVFSQTKERLRYGPGAAPTEQSKSTSMIRSAANSVVEAVARSAVLAVAKKPDGIFAVDLRENEQGQPMVTEINAGRFLTTSTILFEQTNVLFPYYYMKIFLEHVYPEITAHNPIAEDQYLIGSHLTDAKLLSKEQLSVLSWKDV